MTRCHGKSVFPLFAALWLAGCAHTRELPEEVLVPVPVPCEVEQVPKTELPQVQPDMNIFEAAQVRMAQLKLLLAENTKLRAANNNPCPDPKGEQHEGL